MADDMNLSAVDNEYHSRIRDMLRKNEVIWNRWLGYIKVARHAIDLKDGAKLSKYGPY